MWEPALRAAIAGIANALDDYPSAAIVIAFSPSPGACGAALTALAQELPSGTTLYWHHVRLHGLDPTRSFEPGRAVVVLGLDEIEPDDRARALVALNRGRDLVRVLSTRLLLLVPFSLRDTFYSRCADLLAWRNLVVDLPDAPGVELPGLPLPPWPVARDLAARRAVAIVGAELLGEDASGVRALLDRLPWAAIVDTSEGASVLRAIDPSAQAHEESEPEDVWDRDGLVARRIAMAANRAHDLARWSMSIHWAGGPSGSLLSAALVGVGAAPPGLARPALWAGAAARDAALRELAIALAMVGLGAARPWPPAWEPANVPMRSAATTIDACLAFGPDLDLVLGPIVDESALEYVYHRVGWYDWRERPLLDRAIDALHGGYDHEKVRRLLVAHALDTQCATDLHARLLARAGPTVLVTGYDLAVEATLALLERPSRVIAGDGDLQAPRSADAVDVIRPWGDPLRPDTLRLAAADLWEWLDRNPAVRSLIVAALRGPTAWVGFSAADPRMAVLRAVVPPNERGSCVIGVAGPHIAQQLDALRLEGAEVFVFEDSPGWRVADPAGLAERRVESWYRDHRGSASPRGFEPPVLVPEDDYSVRWELLDDLSCPGLANRKLFDVIAERGRLRVEGARDIGLELFARLLCWAIEVRAARDTRWYAWTWHLPKDAKAARFVDLARGGGSTGEIAEWSASGDCSPGDLLAVRLPPPGAGRSHAVAAVAALEARCRLVLLDDEGLPWPHEATIPTVLARRFSNPERWLRWVCRDNPAALAALPALARARAGYLLRNPEAATWVRDHLTDPADPLGQLMSAKMAAEAARLVGATDAEPQRREVSRALGETAWSLLELANEHQDARDHPPAPFLDEWHVAPPRPVEGAAVLVESLRALPVAEEGVPLVAGLLERGARVFS